MKQKVVISILLSILTPHLGAVSVVSGSSTTAGQTFATAILSNAYHQPSKTWYTGMTNGNTTYAIGKATGTGGFTSAVVNNSTTDNIRHLALSHNTADVQKPLLIFSATSDNTTVEPLLLYSQVAGDATRLQVVDSAGTVATLKDSNATPVDTDSIRAITAGNSYAFAAIKTGTGTPTLTTFGSNADDGIALMTIDHTTKKLTITDANSADVGNKALNVVAATISIAGTSVPNGDVTLHWDETLQRLYVGMQATTGETDADRCYGLLIYRVVTNNILTPVTQVTATTANQATINGKIIVAENDEGAAGSVAILKLGTMHTSTGLAYLIVQGGNNTAANVNNKVYALPLVTLADTTLAAHGALADKDSAIVDRVGFGTIAATFANLYNNDDLSALIGGGNLPIETNTTARVSDMKVIGDTVYCSTHAPNVDASNAPGIYYSQAIFDNTGKIVRWSDWAKAGPEALGNSATDGSVGHFAVDATNGTIMASDKSTDLIVRRTAWTSAGTGTTSLVATVSSDLSDGCFSVFDLNQSTINFGTANNAFNRYALFGGRGKVAFAKISTGASAAYLAAETVKTDFSDVDNYLLTTLPSDTAPVTVLGYSKWASGTATGFFFAGTKNGLYVFATDGGGAGFNPAAFADLDAAPFSTFSWNLLTGISGEPRAIKCIGLNVYVLTRDTTKLTTLTTTTTNPTDRLYKIASGTDSTAFTITAVAVSGTTAGLTTATIFHDFEIITSNAGGTTEQVILATNNGLYKSNTGVTTWAQITDPATDTKIYDHLTAPTHNRIPQKVWSSEWLDDSSGNDIWTFSGLSQLTSSEDAITFKDVPNGTFNSDSATLFTRLSPIRKFWSDGARRMYIGIPANSDGQHNKLYTLPFNVGVAGWNVTGELQLTDSELANHERLYWVQQIGATGNIMAGTNKGVISLE